ncbi:GST N domain containing protein [Asbolus verrucosus]|uniref:GST N domain containing protein n=1 Tax=Asbolus verrucosus TaxID=1661398 RepID=A0A482W7M1_ASBVE|nr:GST N domain containing protein [Asbolus verrucosus]
MAPILYMQSFSAPVRSVLMTAAALGIKLQQKVVDLSKQEHLTESFLKLNPQHTIPTLNDDGVVIWDSHAINAYLVGKYGKNDSLYPKDLAKRAIVDQRLHFDSGIIFSWLRNIAVSRPKT